MSQSSQDHSSEPTEAPITAPNIAEVPPCSELQRAVQARAQEGMERARQRASTRPNPLRRIAMLALALIPVALLFTAVDGLLRVFHQINYIYNSPDAAQAVPSEPEPPPPIDSSAEPGMVLLQPLQDTSKAPPPPK
jgi:hypothetical protein